jgi:hypothetical protein
LPTFGNGRWIALNVIAFLSTKMTLPAGDVIGGLVRAALSTLALPLSVLALDYFIRSKMTGGSYTELVRTSGPDGVVLSLGATGAIFLDPHVAAVAGIKSPLFILGLTIFLVFMRVGCIKSHNAPADEKTQTLWYGVSSILTIFFVMAYGYLLPVAQK